MAIILAPASGSPVSATVIVPVTRPAANATEQVIVKMNTNRIKRIKNGFNADLVLLTIVNPFCNPRQRRMALG